jgi:hypothetical protein
MAYKGRYRPSNEKKYIGNPNNIIYRSLWERKFMQYCDLNENIIEWASEEISIPYVSPIDRKRHRYYPDFYIKYKDKDGKIKKSLIEIKPKKQTVEPQQKRRTKSYMSEAKTWVVNQAKWNAAEEFCKDNMWEFKILTEDDLGIRYK